MDGIEADRSGASSGIPGEAAWQPTWTPAERESFFAAIERNRRASWRITAVCFASALVVAVVTAALTSPIIYAIAGLTLDLVNLLVPMPDLLVWLGGLLGPAIDHPENVSLSGWVRLGVLAAGPGLILMGLVILAVWRASAAAFSPDDPALRLRKPDGTRLAEQRFANVIGEMVIAAAIRPAPSVRVSDAPGLNALALGSGDGRSTIVATRALLELLDRNEMQGVAAHLVGSVVDGDLHNGRRVGAILALFGLLARLSTAFTDAAAARRLPALALAALHPTPERARELLGDLVNPFAADDEGEQGIALAELRAAQAQARDAQLAARRSPPNFSVPEPRGAAARPRSLTWREWAWMPLAGPVAMAGFFAGMISTFGLAPLLALAWRRRKYLADATAVRLTREPDALAEALRRLSQQGPAPSLAPWATHLGVVNDAGGAMRNRGGIIASSFVPFFPSTERRLAELAKQGSSVEARLRSMPRVVWLVGVPLGALLALLLGTAIALMAVVSTMLSMVFTALPTALLHFLLRWAATKIGG